ncbi:MAG: DUF3095 domain-containing protein [Magnetospirillum sp.]|nr:DUF3095 domain-containing protein [Magnetospirillum sp.]
MNLPAIRDFAADAFDPGRYARLGDDWAIAVADVIASTQLATQGRDRDVNYVAGAVVAALSAVCARPEQPAACQFGGDGAVAAVPPGYDAAARAALAALAHWARTEMDVPLRVGLVPVAELNRTGHEALAALHDFGNGNVFGQFLGPGVPMAERWVKADERWKVAPAPGELPGLEGLSCRWRPVPPRRGHILCVIIDPLRTGAEGVATLARLQHAIEQVVSTTLAAPLGDGGDLTPAVVPSGRSLAAELRTEKSLRRVGRLFRAMAGSILIGLAHRLGGRLPGLDTDHYRRRLAERTDYRKQAGGPRYVLDVSEDEADRIEALLREAEARDDILYGTARSRATTLTCMVGDFQADRHVHFVDGDGLGFWRASVVLKAKRS